MNILHLLPIGVVDEPLLRYLQSGLAAEFRVPCEIFRIVVDPEFAFHPERQQYHSTEILAWMHRIAREGTWRLLGVTSVDLYIPILTFVFGEAQLGNSCAVVSSHRLRQEFYGLPADDGLLRERVLKEGVHELGHTLGLTHCDSYSCAMAPSHAVEWIDLKAIGFCADCRARVLSAVQSSIFRSRTETELKIED